MNTKFVLKLTALALALGSVSAINAATQGDLSLGSTGSTGDFLVDFVVPPLVRVTIEDDVTLSQVDLESDATGVGRFCVYSNQNSPSVDIAINFANDAGSETVLAGGNFSEELPYTVLYRVFGGATIEAALAPTGYLDENSDEASSNQTCNGGWTHELEFTAAVADINSVVADTYSDTITIMVTAD